MLSQVGPKDCVVVATRETHKSYLCRASLLVTGFSVRDIDQAIVFRVQDEQRIGEPGQLLFVVKVVIHFCMNIGLGESGCCKISIRQESF